MGTYSSKYIQAAVAYVGIGIVIVFITALFIPGAHYRSGYVPLLTGIAVLLLLSYFVLRGVRWLVIFLALLATGRTVWWVYSYFTFVHEEARWAYLINSLLNACIIFMLFRAAAWGEDRPH